MSERDGTRDQDLSLMHRRNLEQVELTKPMPVDLPEADPTLQVSRTTEPQVCVAARRLECGTVRAADVER